MKEQEERKRDRESCQSCVATDGGQTGKEFHNDEAPSSNKIYYALYLLLQKEGIPSPCIVSPTRALHLSWYSHVNAYACGCILDTTITRCVIIERM